MEKIIQVGKGISSIIISGLLYLMGGQDNLITLLFYLIVVDFCLGTIKAIKMKDYSSSMARWGAVNKIVELVMVIIFNHCDTLFGTELFRNGSIIWFCICEGGSLVENLIVLGLPLPDGIRDVFAQVRKGTSVNFLKVIQRLFKDFEEGKPNGNK